MKLFYADEATPAGGGAPVDLASVLAKSGVQTSDDTVVDIPNITTAPIVQATPPAPTEPVKAEPAAPVKKEEEVPIVQETPQAASQMQPADWRTELKKAEKAEILKELGFDEKMVGFYNTWMAGGDIGNYVKAVSVDYSKMTPEQLLKQQIAEEYPEFSPEDLDELYHAKVIDQYKLDPEAFSETEVKRGKLLLQADAKKVRESMIARQKEYILSAKAPAMPDYRKEIEEQQRQQEAANAQAVEQYAALLTSHAATKDFLANKRLTIGEGDDTFHYEIGDPTKAIDMLKDARLYAQNIFNEDGSPQVDKHLFLAAAAIDHKSLAREIFKAGKALGGKQAIEPIENAKKAAAKTTGPEVPLTPVQALARSGVLTHG